MSEDLIIPLDGLVRGRSEYGCRIGKEFFQKFGNEEILDAGLEVHADVDKTADRILVDVRATGSVTVPCDRCLEDLELDVEASALLAVSRSSGIEGSVGADGREILFVGDDGLMDLSQAVYDYVCLSLPMIKVHPEGGCNPATVRFLGQKGSDEEVSRAGNPFAALKGLFDEK